MKNVRWTTAIYSLVSAGSILIAICGMYYGLKSDIKDNKTTSHEELTAAVVSINRKQDSLQHINDNNFKDIWNVIKYPSLVTQRKVGDRVFWEGIK